MKRLLLGAAVLSGISFANDAQAACASGVTNCTTDTTQGAQLSVVVGDQAVQRRIYNSYVQNCASIAAEAPSTSGHLYRVSFCNSVAAGTVGRELLVASILNPTTIAEIVSQSAGCSANNAGCLVDADVNFAIAGALNVTVTSATTAASAPAGTNALSLGADAGSLGIVPTMNVYAAGIPDGTVVRYVTGATVVISQLTSAALSGTPILFQTMAGLPTRIWP